MLKNLLGILPFQILYFWFHMEWSVPGCHGLHIVHCLRQPEHQRGSFPLGLWMELVPFKSESWVVATAKPNRVMIVHVKWVDICNWVVAGSRYMVLRWGSGWLARALHNKKLNHKLTMAEVNKEDYLKNFASPIFLTLFSKATWCCSCLSTSAADSYSCWLFAASTLASFLWSSSGSGS